jgi:hypothetical protein
LERTGGFWNFEPEKLWEWLDRHWGRPDISELVFLYLAMWHDFSELV